MSSTNIHFDQIPSGLRRPQILIEQNTKNAIRGLIGGLDRIVLIAQRLTSGTVPLKKDAQNADMTYTAITDVYDEADALKYFGAGSVAHLTAKELFYAAQTLGAKVQVSILGIADAAGVKSVHTIEVTNATAPADGILNVWVGENLVQVGYVSGATHDTIAAAVRAALVAIANVLPVVVTGSAEFIILTAKHFGCVGNYTHVSAISESTSPLTVTVTHTTPGSVDPTLGAYTSAAAPLYALQGANKTIIVNTLPQLGAATSYLPVNVDSCADLVDFVCSYDQKRYAIQLICVDETVGAEANIKTAFGTSLNHWRTMCGYIDYTTGNCAKMENYKIVGALAAALCSTADEAVPYDDVILPGVPAPVIDDRLDAKLETLLWSGLTPIYVIPGENVAINRAITTHTVNAQSVPEPALLDINTPRTLDRVCREIIARYSSVFTGANKKATPGKPKVAVSQGLEVLSLLEQAEIVKNVQAHKAEFIAEYDLSSPTQLDIEVPTAIVEPLHIVAAKVRLIYE